MKFMKIAKFINNVAEMSIFYRDFFGVEPVAELLKMAIIKSGKTKIFIHKFYKQGANYPPVMEINL